MSGDPRDEEGSIRITGNSLRVQDVVRVARRGASLVLDPAAVERMRASRRVVDEVVTDEKRSYGIRTGFGQLADISIPREHIERLQVNVLRSHACGVGPPLQRDEVLALMTARANSLARGDSGVRPELVEALIRMVNMKVIPYIPEYGSLGASGDLVPLAHLGLTLLGEGRVINEDGGVTDSAAVLRKRGMRRFRFKAKEGISLINGTSAMCGVGALLVHDALDLVRHAEIAAALALDALKGSDRPFMAAVLRMKRGCRGTLATASNIRAMLRGSEIRRSHIDCERVQDAYTLRCIPQILGPARDVITHVQGIVEDELNSTSDNPLILPERELSVSGGNFHGERVALAMDHLALSLSRIAQFSERRVARLLDTRLSGLPPFLAEEGGMNSGLMLLQYVSASLVSETKVLAHPASADSIPVSANQEDFVPMGMNAALKARRILRNARYAVAIELVSGAQAVEFHRPLRSGRGVEHVISLLREHVPRVRSDRPLTQDVERVYGLICEGTILDNLRQHGVRIR